MPAAAEPSVRRSGAADETPVVVGGGQALTYSADSVRAWGALPVAGDGPDVVLEAIDTPSL